MRKLPFLFFNFLIIITIISNIFRPIENIFILASYPFDYVFSKISEIHAFRNSNYESMQNIVFLLNSKTIHVADIGDIAFEVPIGLILRNYDMNINVISNSKISKNSLVVDKEANLIGFVDSVYSNRVSVKKLGWGNNQLFGELDGVDVMIKEYKGILLVEVPEDLKLENKEIVIELPYYIDNINNNKVVLLGDFVSKKGDFYIFSQKKLEGYLLYFLEE